MKLCKTAYKSILILGISTSLFACSTTDIQKMSAIEAVKFGQTQFFDMPNYRFDMNVKLVDLQLNQDANSTNSNEAKKTSTINKYIDYYGKHLFFSDSAIIDTQNQQFQFIPSYGFESKNANINFRFPIVYDHKQKLLYADFSALPGLVTDINHVGKYSKINMANLPIPEDADIKLVQLMRKYATVFYDDLKPEAFTELPLTDKDRKQKAVRKIQVTIKPLELFDKFPMVIRDLAQVFDKERQMNLASLPEEFFAEIKKEMSKVLGENFKDIHSIAFNRSGQIVSLDTDSLYEIDLSKANVSKPFIKLRFKTSTTISDIGKAKIIDPPTEDNTVDAKENFKGSLWGRPFLGANKETQEWDETDVEADLETTATKKSRKSVRKKPR